MKNIASSSCQRCGTCCRKGGPALHNDDLPLLASGRLGRRHLITLRRGETVRENVAGGLAELEREMVKIGGNGPDWTCRLYQPAMRTCLIHKHRPAECRALFCDAPESLKALYNRDRLVRADIIDPNGALWELITFHDQTFPTQAACALAREAAGNAAEARAQLADMVEREQAFRAAFLERAQVDPAELDFYFGRSLAVLAKGFDLVFTKR